MLLCEGQRVVWKVLAVIKTGEERKRRGSLRLRSPKAGLWL